MLSCMSRNALFVDLENLLQGTTGPTLLQQALELIDLTAGPRCRVTVAMSHHFLGKIGHDLHQRMPGARIVVASGVNGADLALLAAMGESNLSSGDQVVLASGDGIFADAVATLAGTGVMTTVVAHRDGLARSLRMAAHAHLYVDALVGTPYLVTAA